MDDEKFMRAALDEARKAYDKNEVPIGAVVVCEGVVVGRGHNLVETLADATAHAEMQAITAATQTIGGKYLNQCVLYVTVEPCIMCAGACAWSQVRRIVYGAADPKRGFTTVGAGNSVNATAGSPILHPRTTVTAGILADECGDLMNEFFRKLRD